MSVLMLTIIAVPLTVNTAFAAEYNQTTTDTSSVQSTLDSIGYEEAQFADVQGVTYNGADDANVIDYYGYGDCWADSSWLYDKLTSAGIQARIMGYVDGGNGVGYEHTWVEINTGNGWQTWDYTGYNSQHFGDIGAGTPYVLIGPNNAPANIAGTGY